MQRAVGSHFGETTFRILLSLGSHILFRFHLPEKEKIFTISNFYHEIFTKNEKCKRNTYILGQVDEKSIELVCTSCQKKFRLPWQFINETNIAWVYE